MEDGWDEEWSFDDPDDAEDQLPQNVQSNDKQSKNENIDSSKPRTDQRAQKTDNDTSLEKVSSQFDSAPSMSISQEKSQGLHVSATTTEKIDSHIVPKEPKFQMLQTYLFDQLQSYSLQFTANDYALKEECNRRFYEAFSSSTTLDELSRYYCHPRQEALFLYTLEKEVPRMEYRVLVAHSNKKRGATTALTTASEIQTHFLRHVSTGGNKLKTIPTVETSSLEHLMLRVANQSLLADALAMITSPDGLVRPQYFATANATSVRFVVDTVLGSINCQATLKISIPSVGEKDQAGDASRVEIATVSLNMIYIPPFSAPGKLMQSSRVPRLECHVVDLRPSLMMKSHPEQFLKSLKNASHGLATMWMDMGYSEPALEVMLGNVHAAATQQHNKGRFALNFNTVQSLREALLNNNELYYQNANAALAEAASKSSKGFVSAWQQLDTATGLGSKVKFLSNMTFLPSSHILALEEDDDDNMDSRQIQAPEGIFPRPAQSGLGQGMFPRLPQQESQQGTNQQGSFPRPPDDRSAQGMFPRPLDNHSAQGTFPRPPDNHTAQGMFPRPPDNRSAQDMFPRSPDDRSAQGTSFRPTENRPTQGMFPRPPDNRSAQAMFPRPPDNRSAQAMFPRPPDDRSAQGIFPRPPDDRPAKGIFPRPPDDRSTQGMFPMPPDDRSTQGMLPRPPDDRSTQCMFPRPPQESKGTEASFMHTHQIPSVSKYSMGMSEAAIGLFPRPPEFQKESRNLPSQESSPLSASVSHVPQSKNYDPRGSIHPQPQKQTQNAPLIGGLLMSGLSKVARTIAPSPPTSGNGSGLQLYNQTEQVASRSSSSISSSNISQQPKYSKAKVNIVAEAEDGDGWSDDDLEIDDSEYEVIKEETNRPFEPTRLNKLPDAKDPALVDESMIKDMKDLILKIRKVDRNPESQHNSHFGVFGLEASASSSSSSTGADFVHIPIATDPAWKRLLESGDPLDDGFENGVGGDGPSETRKRWVNPCAIPATGGVDSNSRKLWFDK